MVVFQRNVKYSKETSLALLNCMFVGHLRMLQKLITNKAAFN